MARAGTKREIEEVRLYGESGIVAGRRLSKLARCRYGNMILVRTAP